MALKTRAMVEHGAGLNKLAAAPPEDGMVNGLAQRVRAIRQALEEHGAGLLELDRLEVVVGEVGAEARLLGEL